MKTSTQLIVLNFTKIGERGLVVQTLSPDFGRRSFLTNVSKTAPMAMFQPLSMLDAEVVENPKSQLWRLKSISVRHSLNSIRTDLYKNAISLFISEVLYRGVKDGAKEDGLFEWCERQILTLEAMQDSFNNFHLRFLLEFASALGFMPDREGLEPFAGDHMDKISELLSRDFASSMMLPLKGEERNEIASVLLDYIGYHSESPINARSLKVLRELFN